MRKWTYLVATLLMAGTTATFTGCIDTDEPEGIVNLRGAKSELIKAEAAVKLVEVEWQKAQVANMELQNKALELANQKAEYDNQLKALDVKLKELDVELKQAKNEAEKARLQAEIAQSNADKKAIENQMALEAEAFKVAMLNAQTATAQAQAAYEQAIQDIELAKLTLSDAEQQQITTAQKFLTSVASVMNGKYQALANAQTEYYNALMSPTMPSIGKLQAQLAKAQAEVEAAEIILNAKSEMLALAEDFDAAAWDTKKAEYKKEISQYESEKGKAELEKTQIENKAEYKAAVEDVTKKTAIESDAYAIYYGGTLSDGTVISNGARRDSADARIGRDVNGVSTRLTIKKYASEPIDASLRLLFDRMNPFTSGYDENSGVFFYGDGSYTQNDYFADLDLDDSTMATTIAAQNLNTVNAWIKVLDNGYTIDANGVAWYQIALDKQKKEAAEREKEFNEAKADWEILVAAFKDGKATAVPTRVKDAWDLEKAVKTYNEDYKALVDAIAAYNTEYDSKYKAAYDGEINRWKTEEKKKVELALMMDVINATPNLLAAYTQFIPANPSIDIQISTAKTVLTNINSGAGIPGAGAINDELDRRYDIDKATIEGTAKRLGLAATATVSNAKIVAAATKVRADITPLQNSINGYKALASYPYGQIPVNALTIIDLTGNGNFYQTKTETDGKVHYEALRKNISTTGDDNEYAKLTATKLKADRDLRTDLGTASRIAFGNVIPTAGELERLTPVEKKDVRDDIEANPSRDLATDYGKLGEWMYSEDMVQYYTDIVGAQHLIDALIVQLNGVKADLEVEIQTNSEKIQVYIEKANEARNAYYEAKAETEKAIDTRDALTAEVQAKIDECTGLIDDMNALINTVDAQIASIATGGATGSTVAEIANYWKKQVASAEETVESKKQEAAAKQKAIDLFKDDKYTAAFDLEQKKNAMDSADDEYQAAKDVYDMALSQLKALITALTK